jgi:hypothetical protein
MRGNVMVFTGRENDAGNVSRYIVKGIKLFLKFKESSQALTTTADVFNCSREIFSA